MTDKMYLGVNNQAKEVKKIYIGINGQAKKIKKGYIGVNGVSKLFYQNSILPEEYQQVEYIRNTDQNCGINTGITSIDNNTTLYFDFAITTYRNSSYGASDPESNSLGLFSLRRGSGPDSSSYLFGLITPSSGVIEMVVPYDTVSSRNSWTYYKKVASVNYTVGSRHEILFNQSGGNFYYDNTLVGSTDATYSKGNEYGFPLFGLMTYTHYFYGGPVVSLYQFSAWKNGNLIRDMYPCYRISNNTIGMYDIVNKTFYTNAESGTFYKGPNIS